jgi:hypothetical protein
MSQQKVFQRFGRKYDLFSSVHAHSVHVGGIMQRSEIMSDKTYNTLKIVVIVLTASCTFCLTLGKAWGLSYYEAIATTLGALATALQYILNEISKAFFKDKEIVQKMNDFDTNESIG